MASSSLDRRPTDQLPQVTRRDALALFALLLAGCSSTAPTQEAPMNSEDPTSASQDSSSVPQATNPQVFPATLYPLDPQNSGPCDRPGELVSLSYDTFEAFSYDQKTQPLSKQAWVYLPYNYDPQQRYNIAYLMHGGWSSQDTLLGTPDNPSTLKHQVDHAIADGRLEPVILVCPTYNNTSDRDSWDYSLAIQLTQRWPQEFVNDLMPAVESAYSTFAPNTTPQGLQASRDYRAFMGFSMGSVATWRVFEQCLPYVRFFCPSSGNAGSGAHFNAAVEAQGYGPEDFFILAMTGTKDFAGSAFSSQIHDMENYPSFLAENNPHSNLVFRTQEGASHDAETATLYLYNDLLFIWPGPALTQGD